jgi:hypothetical protein
MVFNINSKMLEFIIFIIMTIIFFISKFFFPASYSRIVISLYIIAVLSSQFFLNIRQLSTLCKGSSTLGGAALITLLPWTMIGSGIMGGLYLYPGWKQPFSNTFGYGIAKLAGINSVLFKLLKPKPTSDTKLKKTLDDIYTNPSLFINQITPDNFNDFIKNGVGQRDSMFVSGAANMPAIHQFYNIIRVKDLVSEFMWYALGGLLVTTISYNNIVNSTCNNSVKEMKKRHNQYEADIKDKAKQVAAAPPKRIYKTYD